MEKIQIGNMMNESEASKPIMNDLDCEEHPEEFINIVKMVSPILDRNPRRMKQFSNLFRFQKMIGSMTGLFSYDPGTASENMWNCRKLAKFVVISMRWPSLVTALGSNKMLLDQLQEYALKLANEDKKHEYALKLVNEDKNLEKWIKDERLIGLLRYGCMEGGDVSQNVSEYTLLGLDFSKLLQISPEVVYPDSLAEVPSLLPEAIREMKFVPMRAGVFMMGSNENEEGRDGDEGPVHKVTITHSFEMGCYPVTQKQWEAVMDFNPSSFKGANHPVENVSWNDVQAFIKKLNKMEVTVRYRLPSEAEWEYACRAGTATRYFFGDDESKQGDYSWYNSTSPTGSRNHLASFRFQNTFR